MRGKSREANASAASRTWGISIELALAGLHLYGGEIRFAVAPSRSCEGRAGNRACAHTEPPEPGVELVLDSSLDDQARAGAIPKSCG